MLADYKSKIEFKGQLLIEPKAKEPTRHQYDYGMSQFWCCAFPRGLASFISCLLLLDRVDNSCSDPLLCVYCLCLSVNNTVFC